MTRAKVSTSTNTSAATLFLSAETVARIVSTRGIATCLQGIVDTLHADYLRWEAFDKCARVASHSTDGVIELMPISDAAHYAFKYVNGHPKNTVLGLPTVMAFGVLASVDTGLPEVLSELTLTTALRTAAMSALAARALARPESRVMALIGNGAQSDFQALAFHHLLGIEEIRLFDIDRAATAKLARNLANSIAHTALKIRVCTNTHEAVCGADIITTVTADKTSARIITPDMLEPGMHINGVGGDCPGKTEMHPDVLRAASVFVEYESQTRIEGDIQQLPADFAVTEFWRVLAGRAPARQDNRQITLFDSVGFALEDYSALRYIRDEAIALGLGEMISLIPELANPKDLFGFIRAPATRKATLAA